MKSKQRGSASLTEAQVDKLVAAQADEDRAWTKPVRVRRKASALLALPSELAVRAAFLARLHRIATVEEWLSQVIRERIELEEAAFAGAKRDLARR